MKFDSLTCISSSDTIQLIETTPNRNLSYYLFTPDAEDMRASGYAAVAHVPCVFANDWTYEQDASRYLRERALLEWSPRHGEFLAIGRYPTDKSLRVFGEALCNFLEWCELRGIDWHDVDYGTHVLSGYQAEMLRGTWSASGRPLSPATVNLRVGEVCNYLVWASERGIRGAFEVQRTLKRVNAGSARNSHGHKAREVEVRVGAVRRDPQTLRIPTDEEVRRWHMAVAIEKGPTKALVCELILRTGIRREEAAQWRLDTLPLDRQSWRVQGGVVEVTIVFGTKGTKHEAAHGERAGPARIIALPVDLALKLAEYRDLQWPRLRAKYVSAAPTSAERRSRMQKPTRNLFLSDYTGLPLSAQSLYQAWTKVSHQPFEGWCPHGGRHYWACKTLLAAVSARISAHSDGGKASADWITGSAMDTLMLVIKPQLGHVSSETTNKYLVWIQRAFTTTEVQEAYAASLDALIGEEQA